MSEVLVRCENVGKKFCRDLKKSLWYGIKDSATDLLGLPTGNQEGLRDGEFWANRDISFELKRGECLGIVGRNGAGKTTILKILNGLIKPDSGHVEMRGRVGALIALGAGFNPILTGWENLFVNASILGLTRREALEAADEIVEFAGIAEFMDAAVRTYSSGMQVRLGFAIASTLCPDILIVDEVLAVGDAEFRLKCMKRMRRVMQNDCSVILVSHNLIDIQNMANKVLWLEKGKAKHLGAPAKVISGYLRSGHTGNSDASVSTWSEDTAPGNDLVRLVKFEAQPPAGYDRISISSGVDVNFDFVCHEEGLRLGYTLELHTDDGIPVFHVGGRISDHGPSKIGKYTVQCRIPPNLLNSGKYHAGLIIGDSQAVQLVHAPSALSFEVQLECVGVNPHQRPGIVSPILDWNFNITPLR